MRTMKYSRKVWKRELDLRRFILAQRRIVMAALSLLNGPQLHFIERMSQMTIESDQNGPGPLSTDDADDNLNFDLSVAKILNKN